MKNKAKSLEEQGLERELCKLAAKPEREIDLKDVPEVGDWSKAGDFSAR